MPRVEEFLLFSVQCRFMADRSADPAEKAEWDDLARRWLGEAMEIVESEAGDEAAIESRPAHRPKPAV